MTRTRLLSGRHQRLFHTTGLAAMTDLPAYDCTTQQGFTSKLRPTAYPILAALSEPNPQAAENVRASSNLPMPTTV